MRNLRKQSLLELINLLGLAIGMTASIFIFMWVQNEVSRDSLHANAENIYLLTNTIPVNKQENWVWEGSPMLFAAGAKNEIPQIKQTARLVVNQWASPVVSIHDKLFSEKKSAWVDSSWFHLFKYDFIEGSAIAFAKNPFSIIITESKAKQYFGNSNAVGEVVMLDAVPYTIQGVVKENPLNSSFQFDVLLQLDGRLSNKEIAKNDENWNNFGYTTFLSTQEGTMPKDIEASLNKVLNKNRIGNDARVSLIPLTQMYFDNSLQNSALPHGNKKIVAIFSLLGLLLLVIACINYVNLTTAHAGVRAKEVSVRKLLGAKRKELFAQFISESIIISGIAIVISLVFAWMLLPVFNMITDASFVIDFSSIQIWKIVVGTITLVTILSGVYPAALLSSFKPLGVFRGKSILKLNTGLVRKVLVIFQFSLSVMLIISTIVIYRQMHFIQAKNPGYNVSQVMALQIPYKGNSKEAGEKRTAVIKSISNQLAMRSSVAKVTNGNAPVLNVTSGSSGNIDWDGRDSTFNPTIARLQADENYASVFGLQLKEGSWFVGGGRDKKSVVLNETAVSTFHMQDPVIGQRFTLGGDTGQVIGVVKDFHYKNMHEKIGPLVASNSNGNDAFIMIKINPKQIKQAVADASELWSAYIPDQPFNYEFLDDSFNKTYKSDVRSSQLMLIFSILAIIISAIGLFALAAFTAEQRTKEIGIRKVLGASVQQLVSMLSKEFILLVCIAIFIASPLALWAMHNWLQDFAYRIDIGWWIFLVAGLIAIFIACTTVAAQAIKAAIANPVKSLRTD